eukprot:Platyproteum_vivax@DN10553_c0_g1_i1.p1
MDPEPKKSWAAMVGKNAENSSVKGPPASGVAQVRAPSRELTQSYNKERRPHNSKEFSKQASKYGHKGARNGPPPPPPPEGNYKNPQNLSARSDHKGSVSSAQSDTKDKPTKPLKRSSSEHRSAVQIQQAFRKMQHLRNSKVRKSRPASAQVSYDREENAHEKQTEQKPGKQSTRETAETVEKESVDEKSTGKRESLDLQKSEDIFLDAAETVTETVTSETVTEKETVTVI